MTISAKVIADSISPDGKRLTTMQVTFHRFILPEVNTHRVFSRNFSSSRAIPTAKLIEQVRTNPAMPIHFGKNQPGMQAEVELTDKDLLNVISLWKNAAMYAADFAESMATSGAHKQIVNRVIEPYLFVTGIISATEWDNWFELRAHKDAQPEIQALAYAMKEAMDASSPKNLWSNEWHLPYVLPEDLERIGKYLCTKDRTLISELAKKISAARCCRVSYLKQDGTASTIAEDLALCDRLAGARPVHASPFEHQATPDYTWLSGEKNVWMNPELHGNFTGWKQHRKEIEASFRD